MEPTFGLLKGLWSLLLKGWETMRPHPKFLAPYQGAGAEEANISWWHVPVTLSLYGSIEGAQIWLVRLWGDNPPGDGIALRWQSRDRAEGVSRETLRKGERLNVPIAIRDETWTRGDGDSPRAFITNENYLKRDSPHRWPLYAGVYEFWLEVRRGDSVWRSPYRYVLRIPQPGQSNGHFTLSINYDKPFEMT